MPVLSQYWFAGRRSTSPRPLPGDTTPWHSFSPTVESGPRAAPERHQSGTRGDSLSPFSDVADPVGNRAGDRARFLGGGS
jgi:hypothetical protein